MCVSLMRGRHDGSFFGTFGEDTRAMGWFSTRAVLKGKERKGKERKERKEREGKEGKEGKGSGMNVFIPLGCLSIQCNLGQV